MTSMIFLFPLNTDIIRNYNNFEFTKVQFKYYLINVIPYFLHTIMNLPRRYPLWNWITTTIKLLALLIFLKFNHVVNGNWGKERNHLETGVIVLFCNHNDIEHLKVQCKRNPNQHKVK